MNKLNKWNTAFWSRTSFIATILFSFVALFGNSTAVNGQQKPAYSTDPCSELISAHDEIRLRAMASQTALELLRNYRGSLDEAYEASRKSAYAEAVVDVASLAAGWPMGKAVETAILGKVKNTFTEKLVKAGFKSVEKNLLKDPTLNGAIDPMTAGVETLGGVQYDVLKEGWKLGLKELLGDDAGDSVVVVYDLVKLGLNTYKGMKQLDALRAMGRAVDDQLIRLQTRHTEQMDVLENAKYAIGICQDRIAKVLPPDNNNLFWRSVQEYLGRGFKPAPTPAKTTPTESDVLGREWSEQETYLRAYHGTWVRRGTTNVFDGRWESGVAVLTITIAGDNVSVSRVHPGNAVTCQYQGQLQADRVTVKGTYRCSQMRSDALGEWSAVISR